MIRAMSEAAGSSPSSSGSLRSTPTSSGTHPGHTRDTPGTLLQETIGDAHLTAETLGHRGLGSVSGYTKITDQRRREASRRSTHSDRRATPATLMNDQG
jgi:hypothetical protein